MCVLFLRYQNSNIFLGGASLISSNMLITLASALQRYQEPDQSCGVSNVNTDGIYIHSGSTDLQAKVIDENVQRRSIKKIIIHPDYNSGALINDLAILEVESPFVLSDSISPICLPEPGLQTEVSVLNFIN